MQSEAIGELAKALAAAQAVMKAPTKGRSAKIEGKDGRAGYSYKYADLADVIECFREPLTKNGLALVQTMAPVDGHLVLTTKLLHSSGQWLASAYPVSAYQRPQEQGSAITYARRYAVTALLGIAAEDDDDGAAAQHGEKVERKPEPATGDAVVILDLASKIGQQTGKHPDDIIKAASEFTGRDGKKMSFTDPRKQSSAKWLSGVREKLEREWHKLAGEEPGAAEAAEAFTDGLETAPCCGEKHGPGAPCPKAAA